MLDPLLPPELRTRRLVLRPPDPADAPALHAAIAASRPELRRWMTWAQEEATLADTGANLRRAATRFDTREELRLHIWHAESATLIGSSGYHALDWQVPRGEIGYWIATPHTGQGYALEVAECLTTFALGTLGFRRLEIRCDALNTRSSRIPQKLGYGLDACLRHDRVAADDPSELRDTLIFSRVQ